MSKNPNPNVILYADPQESELAALRSRVGRLNEMVALKRQEEKAVAELNMWAARSTHVAIIRTVCSVFGVTEAEIFSKQRPERIANARQLAMDLIRRQGLTTTEVGLLFRADHGTVCWATKSVARKTIGDPVFRMQRAEVENRLLSMVDKTGNGGAADAENDAARLPRQSIA